MVGVFFVCRLVVFLSRSIKFEHIPEKLGFITPTFMTVFELFLNDPMAG